MTLITLDVSDGLFPSITDQTLRDLITARRATMLTFMIATKTKRMSTRIYYGADEYKIIIQL